MHTRLALLASIVVAATAAAAAAAAMARTDVGPTYRLH